eukprot:COSAG02_NODE_15887_length_1133_cov_0.968085_2_plen_80_part_00
MRMFIGQVSAVSDHEPYGLIVLDLLDLVRSSTWCTVRNAGGRSVRTPVALSGGPGGAAQYGTRGGEWCSRLLAGGSCKI